MKLILVESPTKAKTLKKFLKNYIVLATYGHLLDLPQKEFGLYLKNNQIVAKYLPLKGKKQIIQKIKKLAQKAEEIIAASDPDREGEMIAEEIRMILNKNLHSRIKRLRFQEITPSAVIEGLKKLDKINENLVSAQKGRRYLDRIFGYTLSPKLWQEIGKNLSAGRVQSVALRLIVEREEEIKNFKKEEFFGVYLILENFPLKAVLVNEKLKPLKLKKEEIEKLQKDLVQIKKLKLEKVIEEKKKIYPPLPLDTENLQRLAFQFLKFPPKKTMFIAQKLFESGYITYHRTQSHFINKDFSSKIKSLIEKNYGKEYFNSPRSKKEKFSFEAHEAIRPTSLSMPSIKNDYLKLWKLIFLVTLASHFKPLEYLESNFIFKSKNFNFLAVNKELIFDGFSKIYPIKEKFSQKPDVKEGEIFNVLDWEIKKIETKPPSRFTEASLIKKMKELGIGRPSTYVSIIEILKKRRYVIIEKGYLKPTKIGEIVYNFLKEKHPDLIDLKFTAQMETKLDKIASNELDYHKFVIDFWKKLSFPS